MMGASHGAVDHLERIRHKSVFVQGCHDLPPQPCRDPAPELAADTGPLAELFGQVAPRGAHPCGPENPIRNKAVVRGLAPAGGTDGQNEASVEGLFLARHQVSCQAGLHRRYQLESRSTCPVNPFCQHDLAATNSGGAPGGSLASGRLMWNLLPNSITVTTVRECGGMPLSLSEWSISRRMGKMSSGIFMKRSYQRLRKGEHDTQDRLAVSCPNAAQGSWQPFASAPSILCHHK